jgi:hypothetical protein
MLRWTYKGWPHTDSYIGLGPEPRYMNTYQDILVYAENIWFRSFPSKISSSPPNSLRLRFWFAFEARQAGYLHPYSEMTSC